MPNFLKSGLPLILLLLISSAALGQKTIQGTVTDAETGEVLSAANIIIEGTFNGTISNRDGSYSLVIPDSLLPARVHVRFIGYESRRRTITESSSSTQNFELTPSVTELEEIVVTDEDPAIRIMRKVIKNKQEWRKKLETYKADAYNRRTLANDTSIVMVMESISKVFWDKQKGPREILRSRKQTANIEAADNFSGVSYLPNFYDDNIDIVGFDVIGVTHPDALRFYDFKLVDRTTMDGRQVFEIKVIPDKKLQPLFRGTIYVLDEVYALLEVKLTPNEVVKFPPPIKNFEAFFEQQYNNYGGDFWLPVDMRIEGDIKISMVGLTFPEIKFSQLARITDFEVNVPLPDSVYKEDDLFTVDTTTVDNDSLFVNTVDVVPLTEEENQAYTELDSTATLEKAFKPSGVLARFVDDDGEENGESGPGGDFRPFENIPGSFSPLLRFNRVDELHTGMKYNISPVDQLNTYISGGFSTGNERWDFGGGARYLLRLTDGISQQFGFNISHETIPQYESALYTPGMTIATNLFGVENYYDYYRSKGFDVFTRFRHSSTDLSLKLSYINKIHRSVIANSGYDLLGNKDPLLVNPAINEGRLSSVVAEFGYNLNEEYSFGATGRKRIKGTIEYADESINSDFDFVRYQISADWNLETFYNRRFLPNTLDLKLEAGTSTGTLPLQRFGVADAALGIFSPFGALKTIRNRPYRGDSYVSFYAEHNFRTVPFELLGLDFLTDRNYGIIAFAGAARTWFPDSERQRLALQNFEPRVADDLHLEAGLSLNGVFGLFRIDFAQRLDENAFLVNISVSRFF